ncbi:MAG: aldo/keto reductase [Planctomycetaceae bacterium]|jgi:aryl-alcohol dehydrogenase-like predicted oxidoreductase|nr:aldo/keto reductase [Planctomycetaceae bacterium]
MIYRQIGNSGIDASVVAFGAWAIGGWMWGGTEEKASIDALHAAFDNGINLVDTAPAYGFGRSEEIVGKAITGRRDKLVIATKCGLVWDKKEWAAGKGVFHFFSNEKGSTTADDPKAFRVYKYLRPESIITEVEASLKRLKTDYIDILQTHWQDESTPLDDTLAALIKLREQGKIRSIGCSNAAPEQVAAYCKAGLDVDQERFSLVDRQVEKNKIIDLCRENNVSFFAYSPLANGLLTGKITPERKFAEGDLRATRPRFAKENLLKVSAMLEKFKDIAQQNGLTYGQLIIAWTIGRYEKMHALCGIRNANQAAENAKAGEVILAKDVVELIAKTADASGIS